MNIIFFLLFYISFLLLENGVKRSGIFKYFQTESLLNSLLKAQTLLLIQEYMFVCFFPSLYPHFFLLTRHVRQHLQNKEKKCERL